MRCVLIALAVFVLASAAEFAGSVSLYQTAEGTTDRITPKAPLHWVSDFSSDASVVIDPKTTKQTILGFGGAFTDAASYNFHLMSDANREKLLHMYFSEEGIGYTVGRVPINSCDFTRFTYSFDNNVNDTSLSMFDTTVHQDTEVMIPFIKAAMGAIPGGKDKLRLYGSPWSAPAWMKVPHPGTIGKGMNGTAYPLGLLQSAEIQTSWALYFSKWLTAYKKHGIDFWGVTAQNEPQAAQVFESMLYTRVAEAEFIRDYLGPRLRADFPELKIMAWDHNKYTSNGPGQDRIMTQWVQEMYSDPETTKYVDGIAFHWYQIFEGYGFEFEVVNASHYLSPPGKFLLATEACSCGTPQLDSWYNGELYGIDIIGDLANWAIGWVDWNLLLDQQGGPNHVGNYCEAPMIYNVTEDILYILPKYYYMGQISKFLQPDSVVLSTVVNDTVESGPFAALGAVAALRPDGRTALVVMNPGNYTRSFKVFNAATQQALNATIPAHAIQTYLYQ